MDHKLKDGPPYAAGAEPPSMTLVENVPSIGLSEEAAILGPSIPLGSDACVPAAAIVIVPVNPGRILSPVQLIAPSETTEVPVEQVTTVGNPEVLPLKFQPDGAEMVTALIW